MALFDSKNKSIDQSQLHDFLVSLLDELGTEPGSIINILDRIQETFRYIPVEAIFEMSRLTQTSLADLCSLVGTFNDLAMEPVGKHLILVCDGTACHTVGSAEVIRLLEEALGVDCGHTTEDGEYTLKAVYCVGACSLAPIIKIDDTSHGRVRLIDIDSILDNAFPNRLKKEGEQNNT